MADAYIVPAKVPCLLDGVWQLLVQGLWQKQGTDSAQQKQGAQYIIRSAYVNCRPQIHQIRGQHANRIRQNGAQCNARLTHARRIDLQALQIGRKECNRIEKFDERGQIDHQPLVALIRGIGNDGHAGDEGDEKGY